MMPVCWLVRQKTHKKTVFVCYCEQNGYLLFANNMVAINPKIKTRTIAIVMVPALEEFPDFATEDAARPVAAPPIIAFVAEFGIIALVAMSVMDGFCCCCGFGAI
jgi:hypothetical protein